MICLLIFFKGPLSIGNGYQDDIDDIDDDDENAIIDVEDYKIPAISINTAIPSTQTSTSISNQNSNGSTSTSQTKNRIGRPTKSSLSSPVSSSTASDDERLSPDSVKVRKSFYTIFPFSFLCIRRRHFIKRFSPIIICFDFFFHFVWHENYFLIFFFYSFKPKWTHITALFLSWMNRV